MSKVETVAAAFAVHMPETHELRIYRRPGPPPRVGGEYDGCPVDAVWTGLEDADPGRHKPFMQLSDIRRVTCVDEGVAPVSTRSWFAGMALLESVDLERLDLTRLRDAGHMFDGCSRLHADCSGWKAPSDALRDGFADDAPGVIPPSVWGFVQADPAPHAGGEPDSERWLAWADACTAAGIAVSASRAFEDGLASSRSSAARRLRALRVEYPERFPVSRGRGVTR